DWLTNIASRREEALDQMAEVVTLALALIELLVARGFARLKEVASLRDTDGQLVPLDIQYRYDAAEITLTAIRFVREPGRTDDDIVVEIGLTTGQIRFGD